MCKTAIAFCIVSLTLAPLSPQPPGSKRALVIGNRGYRFMQPVPTAGNDARTMASTLRSLNFTVEEGHDLTSDELNNVIERFSGSLRSNDVVLLYYSGNGLQDTSEDLLLPVDFDPRKSQLGTNAYSITKMERDWARRETFARVFILDCCRGNTDLEQLPNYRAGLVLRVEKPGTALLLAAQQDHPVPEDKARTLSLLAGQLAEVLKDPGLKLDDVFAKVSESVYRLSNGTQYPQKIGEVAEFYLTGLPEIPTGAKRENPNDMQSYIRVGKGRFKMGCVPSDDKHCDANEKPQHAVEITHGFWMAETAVTVQAWQVYLSKTHAGQSSRQISRLMPPSPINNPKWAKTDRPMVRVKWQEASDYCKWAGGRLPTEAEWEFAARAGSEDVSNFQVASQNAIYDKDEMPAVKTFSQNSWGLYDLGGIIWEWCSDYFDPQYYSKFTQAPAVDPDGRSTALQNAGHVRRGGAYEGTPDKLRISRRSTWGDRDNKTGFRCVIDNLPAKP